MGLVALALECVSPASVALCLVLALVIRLGLVRLDERRRLRQLGGKDGISIPSYVPLGIGFVARLIRAKIRHQLIDLCSDLFRETGSWTCVTRIVGQPFVVTADPEIIRAITVTQSDTLDRAETVRENLKPLMGNSIMALNGAPWKRIRRLLSHQFARGLDTELDCFERHVQSLFARLALDITADFFLSTDVKSQMLSDQGLTESLEEFGNALFIIGYTPKLKSFLMLSSFRTHLRTVEDFMYRIVDRALQLPPDELAARDKNDSLLQELARLTRDPKNIRDHMLHALLSGRNTIVSTLSFALYELARHPAVVARLRAEIVATVGLGAAPTHGDLNNMTYLRAVINETLRLYPAVPFITRTAAADTTLPRGGGPEGSEPLNVLKGTRIVLSIISMQRRPDLYPAVPDSSADPAVFSPERWAHWHPPPEHFLTFGSGPRVCLGKYFATTQISYVLCRIFQRFARVESHMHPIDGGRPCLKTGLAIKPGQGVYVSFHGDE